uniref:Uncharacterized protein n=1 Tax=Eutreptiella gymnastica TaxID=73025 RepID=A0A7S4FR50_9EUGL
MYTAPPHELSYKAEAPFIFLMQDTKWSGGEYILTPIGSPVVVLLCGMRCNVRLQAHMQTPGHAEGVHERGRAGLLRLFNGYFGHNGPRRCQPASKSATTSDKIFCIH